MKNGNKPKLAVIDIFFPWKQSGFRYWESMMFYELLPDTVFFSTTVHSDDFPKEVYQLARFREIAEKEQITHVYCVFLHVALSLVGRTNAPDGTVIPYAIYGIDLSEVFKEFNIKLSTTLYPGGGLTPTISSDVIKMVEAEFETIFTNIDEVLQINSEAIYVPGISHTGLYTYTPKVKKDKIELIFCAHKGIRKNFSKVIEAFNKLDDSFHLHIVGDWENDLIYITNPNHTFYGLLSPEKLVDVYKRAHVFINASSKDFAVLDGFPTTAAMDAMATGCMLITTNTRNDNYILKENIHYVKMEAGNIGQLITHLNWVKDHFDDAMQIGINGSEAMREHYDARKNVKKKIDHIFKK